MRELQNTIERAAILCDGDDIDAAALQLPAPRPTEEQIPAGMLGEDFNWEGTLAGSDGASHRAHRTIQNRRRAARREMEQDARRRTAWRFLQNAAAPRFARWDSKSSLSLANRNLQLLALHRLARLRRVQRDDPARPALGVHFA